MNLHQLTCFRALARNEHYTRTSEELSVSQSSLSRTIAGLEEELGVPLFERSGRGVVLTKQGRLLYGYVDRGLSQIDTGLRMVRESLDPDGGVVDFAFIYALSPVYIPRKIQEFRALTGDGISFRFYQANTRNILPHIRDGSYDLGLCSWLDTEPELDFTPLLRQEYVLVTASHHPLAVRQQVTLEEAARYDFILPLDETSYVERLFQERHLSPRVTSRVEEDHAAASLVSIGLGLAILPRNPILSQYGVHQISLAPAPLYPTFDPGSKKDRQLRTAAEHFNRILKKDAGTRLGEESASESTAQFAAVSPEGGSAM
ncbi:MAG: LysR family transcriptional regulator [Lachnospiraceae bacterium]|nr:LysR family transcriptional regulator [Lachnospiraceae bacterium]